MIKTERCLFATNCSFTMLFTERKSPRLPPLLVLPPLLLLLPPLPLLLLRLPLVLLLPRLLPPLPLELPPLPLELPPQLTLRPLCNAGVRVRIIRRHT